MQNLVLFNTSLFQVKRVIRLVNFKSKEFLFNNTFLNNFFVSYKEINYRIKCAALLKLILNDRVFLSIGAPKSHLSLLLSGLYRHY